MDSAPAATAKVEETAKVEQPKAEETAETAATPPATEGATEDEGDA